MRFVLSLLVLLAGCGQTTRTAGPTSDGPAQESWWQWHAKKRDVDMAVSEATDPPSNDYAKAVQIIRSSDRPEAVKDHEIGLLIVGSFDRPGVHRPPETLEQGLELIENAANSVGETREYTPQHLRLMFERGAGLAPNNIPVDQVVANCWHRLENGGTGDPARCIELRRQRLPHVGQ